MLRFSLSQIFQTNEATTVASNFTRSRRRNKKRIRYARQLAAEALDERRLLAVVWANEFGPGTNNPGFAIYGGNEVLARALVNRAISDWNSVVLDQNWDNDNNSSTNGTFTLNIFAAELSGARGATGINSVTSNIAGITPEVPVSATILLDDDGGGASDVAGAGTGWLFDRTPADDVEFTSLANSRKDGAGPAFHATFIDVTTPNLNYNDYYRTIVHEIGHALGIYLFSTATNPLLDRLFTMTTDVGDDPNSSNAADRLRVFNGASGTVTLATIGGGHFYEGNPGDAASRVSHPNDLMNDGRTVPPVGGSPIPTTRQFISDANAQLLANAYGYTVALPSARNTAHAMLDSITGTLLVQGRARNNTTGAGVNDSITLQRVIDSFGDNILVNVNGNLERIPYAQVLDIVIHGNGGTDTITVNANVAKPWQQVQFMVSSNQDAVESASSVGGGALTDGIVDLSPVIPGSQTTLRAAIREANSVLTGGSSIYVGRGVYTTTIANTGGDPFGLQGDFDIVRNNSIIGAGASQTVINGNTGVINERIFEVTSSGILNLSRLTITGGDLRGGGDGAGIRSKGALLLTDVMVLGNSSGSLGGGIYIDASSATIVRSTIANNTSFTDGGGIAIIGSGSSVNIINSTISGNASTVRNGGGIFQTGLSASLTMQHSTVVNNRAASGGGIARATGSATIGHSIIANNTATTRPDYHGIFTSLGYNLIENPADTIFVGTTTGNITGVDPALGVLAFNGGLVATHAPLAGSPVIDAGNPSVSGAPATDQRNAFLFNGIPVVFARIADGDGNGSVRIDIGAHERQPTIFGVLSTSLASSGHSGAEVPSLLTSFAAEKPAIPSCSSFSLRHYRSAVEW